MLAFGSFSPVKATILWLFLSALLFFVRVAEAPQFVLKSGLIF